MKIMEVIVPTGEVIIRDETPSEKAEREDFENRRLAQQLADEQAEADKAAARQQLLDRLGITQSEFDILFSK